MVGTATGLLAVVAGIFLMRVMARVPNGKAQWLIERAAAILLVTGGILGLTGVVGQWLTSFTGWVVDLVNRFGVYLFGGAAQGGGGIVGLLAIGLAIWWVMALMPNRIANNDFPDWLIYAGFFIPSLLAASTGPLAALLLSLFEALGSGGASGLQG